MITFSNFTQEIQDLIWQQAISNVGPRNVQLRLRSLSSENSRQCCTSPSPIPPLLHTCRRSRALAMRRWQLSFREARGHYDFSPQIPRAWFDHEGDILLLFRSAPSDGPYSHILVLDRTCEHFEGTEKVRSVACELEDIRHWERESYILVGSSEDEGNEDEEDENEEDENEEDENEEDEDGEGEDEEGEDGESDGKEAEVVYELCSTFRSLSKLIFVTNIGYGKFNDNGMIKVANFEGRHEHEDYKFYAEQFVKGYKTWGGMDLEIEYVDLAQQPRSKE